MGKSRLNRRVHFLLNERIDKILSLFLLNLREKTTKFPNRKQTLKKANQVKLLKTRKASELYITSIAFRSGRSL
uniref:Uncharacterized protein n=1 Tax=Desertifilum tharense IPPAS B-1220 TaxID=1781255 RepID=A0A1E5QDZ2_9CYAN|nr:hypothetical protein BH720_23205 [Desertifilum tharense IPPAS B-1220]